MKTLYFFLIGFALCNTAIGQTESKQPLTIGDHYGGGIIFSLDLSGQHGLIAASYDLQGSIWWGNEGLTGASFVTNGDTNTKRIVAFLNKISLEHPEYSTFLAKKHTPAACACDSVKISDYSDWYLPAINELNEMYDMQKKIGNFSVGIYFSSTESQASKSYTVNFIPGKKNIIEENWKLKEGYHARCIRKF